LFLHNTSFSINTILPQKVPRPHRMGPWNFFASRTVLHEAVGDAASSRRKSSGRTTCRHTEPFSFNLQQGGNMRINSQILGVLALVTAVFALGYPQPGQAQVSVTDQKIASYASAAVEVESLRSEWTKRIVAAESESAQAELREQANGEMVNAVKEEGLSVEEYNAITEAAKQDPELRSRISEEITAHQ
jgi:hypothetical protein